MSCIEKMKLYIKTLGEPSSSQNSCISFNAATRSWFARNCSVGGLPYVCKVNATTDNSGYTCPTLPVFTCPAVTCPTPPSYSPCKNGYTYHNMTGNCYKLYSNISFDLGEPRCNQDGAHLASIHSDEENEFITNFAYDPSGGGLWIGLHYLNGYWQWTDQTPLDYTHYGCYRPLPIVVEIGIVFGITTYTNVILH
uniref:C-type lectin domain-containing protein n=1 Tax=Acrobeloides nanus TaxID=290746 RepID=A0A914C481_9BILA